MVAGWRTKERRSNPHCQRRIFCQHHKRESTDETHTTQDQVSTSLIYEQSHLLLECNDCRPGVRTYTVVVERSSEQEKQDSSPLSSLPQPQRTTMASIFDSDTMVVSDHPKRAIGTKESIQYYALLIDCISTWQKKKKKMPICRITSGWDIS